MITRWFNKFPLSFFLRRFLHVIWFDTQKKDGANTSRIWSSKRNWYLHNDTLQKYERNSSLTWWWHWFFTLKKARNKSYLVESITDADYADDLVLLANTPAPAKSLMHSVEQAAKGIGLFMNSNKTVHVSKSKRCHLLIKPLKFINQFIYISSNISSTESNVNICTGKAWSAIDSLTIIWKSDLIDKIKWISFEVVAVSVLVCGCTMWTLTKHLEKMHDGNYTRTLFEQLLEAALYKIATVWPLASCKPSKKTKHDMLGTGEEIRSNSLALLSDGFLHMNPLVLAKLQCWMLYRGFVQGTDQ